MTSKKLNRMKRDAYIGTGWKFPPAFSKADYSAAMVSGEEDIRESLYILLSTMQGERIMLPEYGAGLRPMLYENLNNTLIHLMKNKISQAILFYEPRIGTETIDVTHDTSTEGLVWINIAYTISVSNERANMVYPFYLTEGTNIPFKY
jgi:phage baseplate assembly protein W